MNALLDMIDLVYEAPQTNGAGWHDLIDRFGEAFPHCHTVLGTYRDGAVELSQTATDIPDSFMQEYSDHFVWVNPVVEPLMNVPGGSYFDADSFISNNRLRQTEIYNDFWVRLGGLDRNTGVILENGNGFFSTFCTHYPSRFRVEDPDGSPDHVLNRLMPHLRRALALQRKIEATELMAATLTDALNASRAATFIVDREKKIRFHNTAAEEMLLSGDIVRSGHLNRLTFSDAGIRNAVMHAIARATDPACEAHDTHPLLHSSRDGTVLRVSVMPAPSNRSFGTSPVPYPIRHAIVTIEGGGSGQAPSADMVARVLNLTEAEGRIAVALYEGLSVADYANARAISIHTARNQLKSVFRKSGVSRQSELVQLIARMVG